MRGISKAWCLLLVPLLSACAPQPPHPQPVDFAHLLARGISRGLPGMWLAVGTTDELEWSGAAGFSNLDGTVDAELDDRVHMASITKVVTAVTALQIVEQGSFSLDDRLVDLLDAETIDRIPYIESVTLAQLLDHSSGIYGFNNNADYLASLVGPAAADGRSWTPRDFVALAYEGVNEPFGRPGEGHHYGDTNYVLLGLAIEQVTGRSLKEHVARPIRY